MIDKETMKQEMQNEVDKDLFQHFDSIYEIYRPFYEYDFDEAMNKVIELNDQHHLPQNYTGRILLLHLEYYYVAGQLHRENGPAYICDNHARWYLFGHQFTFEEYWERQKNTNYANEIMSYILGANNE